MKRDAGTLFEETQISTDDRLKERNQYLTTIMRNTWGSYCIFLAAAATVVMDFSLKGQCFLGIERKKSCSSPKLFGDLQTDSPSSVAGKSIPSPGREITSTSTLTRQT